MSNRETADRRLKLLRSLQREGCVREAKRAIPRRGVREIRVVVQSAACSIVHVFSFKYRDL